MCAPPPLNERTRSILYILNLIPWWLLFYLCLKKARKLTFEQRGLISPRGSKLTSQETIASLKVSIYIFASRCRCHGYSANYITFASAAFVFSS